MNSVLFFPIVTSFFCKETTYSTNEHGNNIWILSLLFRKQNEIKLVHCVWLDRTSRLGKTFEWVIFNRIELIFKTKFYQCISHWSCLKLVEFHGRAIGWSSSSSLKLNEMKRKKIYEIIFKQELLRVTLLYVQYV